MSTVQERVLKVFAEQHGMDISDLSVDDRKDDFFIDSLDDVEIVMALEDEFELEVPDPVAERWITIKDVVEYFAERAK